MPTSRGARSSSGLRWTLPQPAVTVGQLRAIEGRYEIRRSSDWDKVPNLPCTKEEAEERRVFASSLRLAATSGQNEQLLKVAKAAGRAANYGTRLTVFTNIEVKPDQFVFRGHHVLKADPGRRRMDWGDAREYFLWVRRSMDAALAALPADPRRALEFLENVRAALDVLSLEADGLTQRAVAVAGSVEAASRAVAQAQYSKAASAIKSARNNLPRT